MPRRPRGPARPRASRAPRALCALWALAGRRCAADGRPDTGGAPADPRAFVDCDDDAGWAAFRRLLGRHPPGGGLLERAARDPELARAAEALLVATGRLEGERYERLQLAVRQREYTMLWFMVDEYRQRAAPAHGGHGVCLLGHVAASLVLGATRQDRALLHEASVQLFPVGGNLFLDVSSSSSWPFGALDLMLNVGEGRFPYATVEALRGLTPPFNFGELAAAPPEDMAAAPPGDSAAAEGPILAWVLVDHVGLDMEVCSLLALMYPARLRLVLVFLRGAAGSAGVKSGYMRGEDSTVRRHVCELTPEFCAPPHAAVTLGGEEEGRLRGGAAPDLLLCSWHIFCEELEALAARPVPVVSLYSGLPLNQYCVRTGSCTVEGHFRGLHRYVDRHKIKGPQ